MKLVVISGRSGSGKSTALQALEDVDFYCIDNLPALLMPSLVEQMLQDPSPPEQLAVSIDARNLLSNLRRFPSLLEEMRQRYAEVNIEVLYLDASDPTLIKRYSATRRKHPLSDDNTSLKQAIEYERELLEPIANLADLRVDTTRLKLYDLRDNIKERVSRHREQQVSLQFESFGFKHGLPLDADFTFDVRVLPNPFWVPDLRAFTGLEEPVIQFLEQSPEVAEMVTDIQSFIEKWMPAFRAGNRSYVTIAIGCTGGQHRSVYIANRLAGHFRQQMENVHVRHRELD
ncbi:nucleotide-binding protein [Marinobacterium nitratireducens]|uniref:Nucleotide-binding protein n=1 Tax=Marinobacterium nitratireducens TaxID=518897 RepID=A0A917ZHM0_9GAMM|nr:RNase adapter RapZ [Marinobacterium nitratireducens]GGO82846.1 nucleotide-binding protein [Marinobacterium nitratireducens]